MCNLYSITRAQEAMRRLFVISHDLTGNLPPMPSVFPDLLAPIVRSADDERRLELMRWGMPGPPQFGGAPVTNIRNTKSPHWRRWLGPESRCLVPANSFCEWADTKPRKTPTWFALDEDRPLVAFAGIWTTWRGVRGPKSSAVESEHRLYCGSSRRARRKTITMPAPAGLWRSRVSSACFKLAASSTQASSSLK